MIDFFLFLSGESIELFFHGLREQLHIFMPILFDDRITVALTSSLANTHLKPSTVFFHFSNDCFDILWIINLTIYLMFIIQDILCLYWACRNSRWVLDHILRLLELGIQQNIDHILYNPLLSMACESCH